jgi:hypothetical protein
MTNAAQRRRRLPARVYWFRRTVVLVTALALVFAIAQLLGGSGSGKAEDTATVTAAKPSTSTRGPAGPLPIQAGTATARAGKQTPRATGTPVVLAEPTGPCAVDEITVTPTVPTAVAGRSVEVVLKLTGIRPACTFAVTSRTVVAKVTSGPDRIWSTQDCPKAITAGTVVVRSAVPTNVVVRWTGRRSDDQCSRSTSWALPGYYHVVAAVIGSEPGETQFRLGSPPRPIVTRTAHPKKQTTPKVD